MLLIIITKNQQPVANTWCKNNIDTAGGEFTFTVPLYTGDVHTHYVACFQTITSEQFADMDAHFAYTYDVTDSADVQAVYDIRGLNTGPQEGI